MRIRSCSTRTSSSSSWSFGNNGMSRSQQQQQKEPDRYPAGIRRPVRLSSSMVMVMISFVALNAFCINEFGCNLIKGVQALPFPAPNFKNCNNYQNCCPPPYNGTIVENYKFDTKLPIRVRPPAQLMDDAYIAKLQKAYELLRALPDTDGRSWLNQGKLHCAYCNAAFFFPQANGSKPLEVHFGWIFLPWHRLYIYFHERILAKLLNDDTFALPFWNWDNQSPNPPFGNVLPPAYAFPTYGNKNSSLYDVYRNPCTPPPNIIDLQLAFECANQTAELKAFLRAQNNRIMYNQMVSGAPLRRLFFGEPYDLESPFPGRGAGTLETTPHGPVHAWTGNPAATPPFRDMGLFEFSAFDPVFFAHHGNVDRMWEVWKSLPGGYRKDINNPDYLNSEFLFYDENGSLVKVKVAQALDLSQLRYKYEKVPNLWIKEGSDAVAPRCFPAPKSEIQKLIYAIHPLNGKNPTTFSNSSITFRVRRPTKKRAHAEEVLVVGGLKFENVTIITVNAFLYFPTATNTTSITCREFFGFGANSPVEFSPDLPDSQKEWRFAIGPKLKSLGMDEYNHVIVTLVQQGAPQTIQITTAQIVHFKE